MEKDLKDIPLPLLLRYGLTGLVALGLLGVVPLLFLRVLELKDLLSVGSVAAVAVASIATGFVLDALKIYQLTPGYKRKRAAFAQRMAEALCVPREMVMPHFARASFLEREAAGGSIFFMHSRWVMMTVCTTLFFFSGILSLIVAAATSWLSAEPRLMLRFVWFGIACLALSLRLKRTEGQEQQKVDSAYVEFCRRNRMSIRSPELGAASSRSLSTASTAEAGSRQILQMKVATTRRKLGATTLKRRRR